MLLPLALGLPPAGAALSQELGPDAAPPTTPAALAAPPSLNPLAQVDASDMTSFLGRPLFAPSRRPAAPAPVIASAPAIAAAAPLPSAAHIRLVGTLTTQSGSSALIQDTARGVTHTVPEGGTVDGWRVSAIRPSGVRIEQGSQSMDLDMFRAGQPAPSDPTAGRAASTERTMQPAPLVPAAPVTPLVGTRPEPTGSIPPGTVAGTAAAEIAASSPYKLTFGTPPAPPAVVK